MRSTSDPTRVWRRRARTVLAIGIVAPVALLVWALQPLPPADPVDASLTALPTDDEATEGLVTFDRTAFAAPIWNPVPAPKPDTPSTTARERAAPPVRLRLIGIVRDVDRQGSEILRAALYDPTTDKLHIVTSGEAIAGVVISVIDDDGVALESGGHTSRLELRDEQAGGGRR